MFVQDLHSSAAALFSSAVTQGSAAGAWLAFETFEGAAMTTFVGAGIEQHQQCPYMYDIVVASQFSVVPQGIGGKAAAAPILQVRGWHWHCVKAHWHA